MLTQVHDVCSDVVDNSLPNSTPASNDPVLASINHLSDQVGVSNFKFVRGSSVQWFIASVSWWWYWYYHLYWKFFFACAFWQTCRFLHWSKLNTELCRLTSNCTYSLTSPLLSTKTQEAGGSTKCTLKPKLKPINPMKTTKKLSKEILKNQKKLDNHFCQIKRKKWRILFIYYGN